MEHEVLSLEYDEELINNILEDQDMRYIILFLYIIRNDLFDDLNNPTLIEAYEKVLILDDIYKDNVIAFWDRAFTETAIDLGLFKNVRSVREFEQKEGDFMMKLGAETITIEKDVISVPDDTLFLMITKKFKSMTRRNFNLALTRLKGVSCQKTNIIHPFIYEIGEHDYTISDHLYYILDQFGNIFQAIKIEFTISGFIKRFQETKEKISKYIEIFDPLLNTKPVIKKISQAIEQEKDIINYLKDEGSALPDKFNYEIVDKKHQLYQEWVSLLNLLLNTRLELKEISNELTNLKSYYSGKNKKYGYLMFIQKISFNEEDIVNNIQNLLLRLRNQVIEIDENLKELNTKKIRLLNLDFERLIITSRGD